MAWNAPFYRRLGFAELDFDHLGDELREVRLREASEGLDVTRRTFMALTIEASR